MLRRNGVSKVIPWFQPAMAGLELEYIKSTFEKNYINDGPLTREFEKAVANIIGVHYAVAVPSGTVAIAVALMALDIGPGDEVIVPNLTFIATANAVRLTGAKPVLVDIDPFRFTIDPLAAACAISPKTKAIVPVDVNGRGADYNSLEILCKKHGIFLVCDSAEAFGSKYKGKNLGSFGDVAALSFSANKTISTGQGGMLLTSNEKIFQRANQIKDQGRLQRGSGGDDLHPTMGYNFKFTDLQAAVGLAQLEAFEKRCKLAAARDAWYFDALKSCSEVMLPDYKSEAGEIRQWTDILINKRDVVKFALDQNNMGNRAFWHPLNKQVPYADQGQKLIQSNLISEKGIWLPSSFSITEQDVLDVAEVIKGSLFK
jgi:perosamine synthetase